MPFGKVLPRKPLGRKPENPQEDKLVAAVKAAKPGDKFTTQEFSPLITREIMTITAANLPNGLDFEPIPKGVLIIKS